MEIIIRTATHTASGKRSTSFDAAGLNTRFQLRDDLGGYLFIKRNTRAIAAAHGATRRLAALAASLPFPITNCHHRLHESKIRRNRPRRGGVGGKQRPERGGLFRAHPKGCNEEKDPVRGCGPGQCDPRRKRRPPRLFRSRHKQRRRTRAVHRPRHMLQ